MSRLFPSSNTTSHNRFCVTEKSGDLPSRSSRMNHYPLQGSRSWVGLSLESVFVFVIVSLAACSSVCLLLCVIAPKDAIRSFKLGRGDGFDISQICSVSYKTVKRQDYCLKIKSHEERSETKFSDIFRGFSYAVNYLLIHILVKPTWAGWIQWKSQERKYISSSRNRSMSTMAPFHLSSYTCFFSSNMYIFCKSEGQHSPRSSSHSQMRVETVILWGWWIKTVRCYSGLIVVWPEKFTCQTYFNWSDSVLGIRTNTHTQHSYTVTSNVWY